jgi:predicted ATPase/class 3 adenylate cyclase
MSARNLPAGTVTFLFTDVEGSTRLLHELGAENYAEALAEHRRVVRDAFEAHGGVEVDTQGDAFFVAFPTAPGAMRAAASIRARLAEGPIRVRMGVHTGTPLLADEGYVGEDVHRAARIAACGHGGQVLVSSTAATLVNGDGLVDLGEHRLKDLSAPERIYQLGVDEFPPLKSLYRTNLPIPATPFLGRETELGEVCDLLTRDDVRLLTLTGAGGTGKTRLALQSAGALADRYPDGVYWVPLAPLRDPQLVLQGAAQAVGADDGLAEHISDKRLLLLFDNFEHLTDAATDAAALLAACRNLSLLVTSREPLHVSGEQEYAVPPLVPDEAIAFFTARARGIRPDFVPGDAVPLICQRLDDLPLALELAAARIKALSPAQILERLEQRLPLLTGGARDAPERQRTLRATIEWSHDLLDMDEQRLYACLAVFRGGCTLDAAEQIAEADLDAMQSLVDKSLVRHNEDRFWMLETIREHAEEHLESSGEADELRRRHALHFLALAEEADPYLREVALRGGHHHLDWLDRLESEHDNLRAALDRLAAAGETQLVLRTAGALVEFWFENAHFVELRTRLLPAIEADGRPTAPRAKALLGACDTLALGNDDPGAVRCAEEALAIYRALGDRSGSADSLFRLGASAVERGDYEAAVSLLGEAQRLFEEVGDRDAILNVTRSLGWTFERLGDRERARRQYAENLAQSRAIGNTYIASTSLGALATLAAEDGRADEARALVREHLPEGRDFGKLELSTSLFRVAYVLARTGRVEAAATVLACAEAISDEIGAAWSWMRELNQQTSELAQAQLGEQAFADASERGRALSMDEAVAFALDALD